MLLSSILLFYRKKITDFSLIFSICQFILFASSTEFKKSKYDVHRDEIAQKYNGYDCGKRFFTDDIVSHALNIAFSDTFRHLPQPYGGPLYERSLGYLTWPISLDEKTFQPKNLFASKIWHSSTYQVVFTNNGEVIDLIVRMKNYGFAKCSRIDHSKPEAQYQGIELAKGYFCGGRFIPKDHLERSAYFARKYLGDGRKFPAPYIGHLYRQELGYLIWPIYKGEDIGRTPENPGSSYMVVLDSVGQPKDVIARTNENSYVKCIISINTFAELAPNKEENIPKVSMTSGFDCHGSFFDDKYLQIARDEAYSSSTSKEAHKYPAKYVGPPFESPCLLWPISNTKDSIRNGHFSPFRLVLSLEFQVICVVIKSSHSMKACERRTIRGGPISHDPDDYECSGGVFLNIELLKIAEMACRKRRDRRSPFPLKFDSASFVVPGPYLIYPIMKGLKNYSNPGLDYMVMNYNCILAGAVTKDKITGEFRKCGLHFSVEGLELGEIL